MPIEVSYIIAFVIFEQNWVCNPLPQRSREGLAPSYKITLGGKSDSKQSNCLCYISK